MSVINEAIKKAAAERIEPDFRQAGPVELQASPKRSWILAAGAALLVTLVFFAGYGLLRKTEDRLSEARADAAALKGRLDEARRAAAEEADRRRVEIEGLNSKLDDASARIASLKEEARTLQEDAMAKTVEIDRLNEMAKELEAEKQGLLERLNSLEAPAAPAPSN